MRAIRVGDIGGFVARWLTAHPGAVATPISRVISTNTQTGVPTELVYIWVEDGAESLNVDLVRGGMVLGGTMIDMVDNRRGYEQFLKSDPKFADALVEIERERAAAPQDRIDRLVPDTDYQAQMTRVRRAEREARGAKLGIWSDAMKGERQAEGIE